MQVPEVDARNFASEKGIVFRLTSACSGTGIEELFKTIGCKLLELNYKKEEKGGGNSSNSNNNEIYNENIELKKKINNLKDENKDLNDRLNNIIKEKDIIKKENIELKKQNNDLLLELQNLNKETKNNKIIIIISILIK